jgi:ribosomal protein S18 acetylase RimI-like enzyme
MSPGTFSVRRAVTGDAEALAELYTQLAEDRAVARPARGDDASELLASILDNEDRCLLVATLEGAVVGTADMVVVGNLTYGGRPWAAVENVVVDQHHRGQGIGTALVREVIRRATDARCCKVQLMSLKHRKEAHRFYRSLGFQTVAEGFRMYLD